ncbi:MAG: leucine-rich repeat domain-containing protein [Christensenellales bacterium]
MKKYVNLPIVLILCVLLVCILTSCANKNSQGDEQETADGSLGSEGLEMTLEGDAYSVTGIGTCADSQIVIPKAYNGKPVVSIGDYAFAGCYGMVGVVISDGVKDIGDGAFYNCTRLTSATIAESVIDIGEGAFYGCGSIENIIIPKSVAIIGGYAFAYCDKLTSIVIPDSVTDIGKLAFYGCAALTSITIPKSIMSVGQNAFHKTAWYNNQPDGVVYLNKVLYCYKGTMPADTSIIVKGGIVAIAEKAFYTYDTLVDVFIPDCVMAIGDYAFGSCVGLSKVYIPQSVTTIGEGAFQGTAWYNNHPDGIVYVGKVLYRYKGSMPENTKVAVKEGTTSIAAEAFYGCDGLRGITIPDSVAEIGDKAFYGCGALTGATIPDGVVKIGENAFNSCNSLVDIDIGKGLKALGRNAFSYCNKLEKITVNKENAVYEGTGNCLINKATKTLVKGTNLSAIPEDGSVREIGESAFCGCEAVESITVPYGVTGIGKEAFSHCQNLASVSVPNSVIRIGREAFSGTAWYNNQPDGVVYVGKVLYGYKGEATSATAVTVSAGSLGIAEGAFDNCGSVLTSIDIPDSVIHIDSSAFINCKKLKEIKVEDGNRLYKSSGNCLVAIETGTLIVGCADSVIPTDGSVKKIGDYAFIGRTELTSISIPVSVTSVGNYAFAYSNLERIIYGGSIMQWCVVKKGIEWNWMADCTVRCTDGAVTVNRNASSGDDGSSSLGEE